MNRSYVGLVCEPNVDTSNERGKMLMTTDKAQVVQDHQKTRGRFSWRRTAREKGAEHGLRTYEEQWKTQEQTRIQAEL